MILASSRYSPEFIEGLLAFVATVFVATLLPIRPRIRTLLTSRSRRFVAVYVAALIAASLLAIVLVRDMLTPDPGFRRAMLIGALSLALVAFPTWFVAILNSSGGLVRDYRFRGLNGRALPSVIAACWVLCVAGWIIEVYPLADRGFLLAAILGFLTFFVLALSTSRLGHPAFLVPVGLRGRQVDLPDLVSVIADQKEGAGWHGWSTDLAELNVNATTLDGLDRAARAYLEDRFGTSERSTTTALQFLAEATSTTPAGSPRKHDLPTEQLFEAKRQPGGGYTAESAEQRGPEIAAATLEELLVKVAATGSPIVRLTWSHDLRL